MRLLAAIGVSTTLSLLAPIAAADDPPSVTIAPAPVGEAAVPPKTGRDYTVPMLMTDLLFIGTFSGSWTAGYAADRPGVGRAGVALSLVGFVGSGALYHELFDIKRKTLQSIAVRTLSPALISLAVWSSMYNGDRRECRREGTPDDRCNHDDAEVGAAVGAVIGMLAATVIEATILGPDGRKPLPPPPPKTVSIAPTLSMEPGGGALGVVGRF